MSYTNRGWWVLAVVALLSLHGSSHAQTGAGGGGGTGAGGGTSIGGGGGGTSIGGGGGTSIGGGGTGNTFSGGFTLGMSGTASTANTNTAINSSNFLAPSFGNPYYAGRAGATANQAPGGFGLPLFTGTTGNTGNRAGAGAQGGQGGTAVISTNTAGGGTQRNTQRNTGNNSNGIAISYGAVPKFRTRIVPSAEVQTNLRNILNRSTSLSNPGGIDVVMEEGVVIIRGRVASEDEARLAENMLRLSPGVRELRNELVVSDK